MVSFVLEHYFEVPAESLDRAKNEHALSMGAENIVGDLLERYLASVLEPQGWIWCSGSLVKAVDFVLPPTKPASTWLTTSGQKPRQLRELIQ
jgi:SinI restriction endonuclease